MISLQSETPHRRLRCTRPAALAVILLCTAAAAAAGPLQAAEASQLVEQAKAFLLQGDPVRAHELSGRVIASQGLSREIRFEALLTRCAAGFETEDDAQAFSDCERAEQLVSRSWRVHALRGVAFLARGDAEAAVKAFRTGLRRNAQPHVLRRGLREARRARDHA